jgi:hypothetical protein
MSWNGSKVKGKPRGRPFQRGYDERRHTLTKQDCRKGYVSATRVRKMPSRLWAWLRKKITRQYAEKAAARRSDVA